MSRTRYRIFENEQEYPYFLTCTIVGWLPVFTRPEAVQIVLDSRKYLQTNSKFLLLGYAILENHLHLIARSLQLSDDVQRFKSFTARRIIDLLRDAGAGVLLNQLERLKLDHKTESTHQLDARAD